MKTYSTQKCYLSAFNVCCHCVWTCILWPVSSLNMYTYPTLIWLVSRGPQSIIIIIIIMYILRANHFLFLVFRFHRNLKFSNKMTYMQATAVSKVRVLYLSLLFIWTYAEHWDSIGVNKQKPSLGPAPVNDSSYG